MATYEYDEYMDVNQKDSFNQKLSINSSAIPFAKKQEYREKETKEKDEVDDSFFGSNIRDAIKTIKEVLKK